MREEGSKDDGAGASVDKDGEVTSVRYEVSVGLGYRTISMVLNNTTLDSSGLWIGVRSPGHEQFIFA